jgi:hypothetical protein
MIEGIKIKREEAERIRKEFKKEGWISGHYFSRHGYNVDKLRAMAKKEELDSKVLNTDGFATTWYYKESDVKRLKSEGKC